MTLSLGLRILGVLFAIAGIGNITLAPSLNALNGVANTITGLIMLAIGCGLFLWGYRRRAID